MLAPAERARIVAALRHFGIGPEVSTVRASGNGILFRFPDPRSARRILHDRSRFRRGPLGILHSAQVGGLDTEFRSFRRRGELSLHVVLGRTGLVFADLDRYNPYQDASGLLLHGLFELAPHLFRALRRRLRFSLASGTAVRAGLSRAVQAIRG